MLRIYPIRTTRNRWVIKFYCKHCCNDKCKTINNINEFHQLTVHNNPDYKDGKCSLCGQINKSFVRISTFNKNEPNCERGLLLFPDEKVIPDRSFTISIFFPLSYVFNIMISSDNGFTRSGLIYSIKMLYEFIYAEELRTASPQLYKLKKICSACGIKDLADYSEDIKNDEEDQECSICYDNYLPPPVIKIDDDYMSDEPEGLQKIYNDHAFNIENITHKGCKLNCSHIFHTSCIKEWLKTAKSCPMCRQSVFNCGRCDGQGVVYYYFNGVVIPLEQRGNILNRNQSNGVFGISTYDYEDLILNHMYYDRLTKKLYLNMSG